MASYRSQTASVILPDSVILAVARPVEEGTFNLEVLFTYDFRHAVAFKLNTESLQFVVDALVTQQEEGKRFKRRP